MKKSVLIIGLVVGMSLSVSGQKSRVLSVFQMIESEQYEEAKEAVDLAVSHDNTSKWHRTFYAKGLLCQTAFEAGFEKNELKKTSLYPDQLFVAYASYEKAIELDSRRRSHSAIETQYYMLANDFQLLGERHYQKKEYSKAMDAFEHALFVSKSPLLSVKTDTNLVYNTAMAAYQCQNWEKAISYLTGLNKDTYSVNTAMLLFRSHMASGDSVSAEEVLVEGVERYDYDRTLVLQLVDLYVAINQMAEALSVLDRASEHKPENHYFPWTRGLIYQKRNMYEPAIENLKKASVLAPGEVTIYYNIGICYYNMGVAINESARYISNNNIYQSTRLKAKTNFLEAVKWFERAYETDPGHQPTITKLSRLYQRLEMNDKQMSLKRSVN